MGQRITSEGNGKTLLYNKLSFFQFGANSPSKEKPSMWFMKPVQDDLAEATRSSSTNHILPENSRYGRLILMTNHTYKLYLLVEPNMGGEPS